MFVAKYAGTDVGGIDPFAAKLDTHGLLTHGHLSENNNHGGRGASVPDVRRLASGPPTGSIAVNGFVSSKGDLNVARGALPTVRRGGRLTFVNRDASRDIFHTITGCRAPCNATTGIAYPRANGPVDFDSGELGVGGAPASGRTRWSTPKSLPTGTYTYFCRIHPFMRGGFRVVR
jgi:plastocyanin